MYILMYFYLFLYRFKGVLSLCPTEARDCAVAIRDSRDSRSNTSGCRFGV